MLPGPPQLAKLVIHGLEAPLGEPPAEGLIDGHPGREVLGQHSPGAAGAEYVEARIQDLPPGIFLRPARPPRRIEEVLYPILFGIRKPARISNCIAWVPMCCTVSVLRWSRLGGCGIAGLRSRCGGCPVRVRALEPGFQQILTNRRSRQSDPRLPPEHRYGVIQREQRILPNQRDENFGLLGRQLPGASSPTLRTRGLAL
jgi:hypothetical protein